MMAGPYRIEDWERLGSTQTRIACWPGCLRLPCRTSPATGRRPRVRSAAPKEYAKRIIDLLDFIPDFRAEPIEHATNGDVMFVRWIARGTGPNGAFEAVGVDRIIAPNGYVRENLIVSDHSIFADFAKHVGDFRGA